MEGKRLPRSRLPSPGGQVARNDMRVEGEVSYPAVSQYKTFSITSVRLSLVTKSVSTSGWRLISPTEGNGGEHNSAQNFLREEFQGHHPSQGEGSGLLQIRHYFPGVPSVKKAYY
jgi:hypothetical protein